ncbi:MAG: hypothetical protein JW889_07290 [Verrucomicrobia bacterium]|nr:hypothetical protein [Verrucomicrobiota bacterium]
MRYVTLRNDSVEAAFDAATGALAGLVSKATGWRIQNRAGLGLSFKLLVPLPDRRNNLAIGTEQEPPCCTVSPDGALARFVWEQLKSVHGGPLDVRLELIVTLDPEGLTFEAAIENRSSHVVEAMTFPCLGDIPMPSPDEPLTRITCHCELVRRPLLPEFHNDRGYWGVDYPAQMSLSPHHPFLLVASEQQGCYIACHEPELRGMTQFLFLLKPGYGSSLDYRAPGDETIGGTPVHLELDVSQFPFLAPGGAWRSSPIVVRPYIGTWHKGADHYKHWLTTWLKHAKAPGWARDVHSWQQIHINSPEDDLRCRYTELVTYGEDCAKHGVRAIQLVGWNRGGQDRGNPSHDTDPRLGTKDELRDAIAAIHALGVKVVLFNKYTWSDTSTDWYRRELHTDAAKDPYGNPYHHPGYTYQTPTQLADINTRRFVSMCHLSKRWRAIACHEFEKNIELGAAGILYDEVLSHGQAHYCFDPDHGHPVPGYIYGGDLPLAAEFRALADEHDPGFLLCGEALFAQLFRGYAVSYFRVDRHHEPGHRYFDPFAPIMVAVHGFDDREKLNACLLWRYIISYEPYNFKGRLDGFPLTIEYGKKIDALRARYREFLWDGEFRDVLGASAIVDGKPHRPYSVFVQPRSGKRAVAIANHDATREIEASVKLDGDKGRLVVATPERPDAVESDDTVAIPPRSLAVLMEG